MLDPVWHLFLFIDIFTKCKYDYLIEGKVWSFVLKYERKKFEEKIKRVMY